MTVRSEKVDRLGKHSSIVIKNPHQAEIRSSLRSSWQASKNNTSISKSVVAAPAALQALLVAPVQPAVYTIVQQHCNSDSLPFNTQLTKFDFNALTFSTAQILAYFQISD